MIVGLFLPPEDVDGYVIITTISVGKNPDGVELNPDTNRAYTPKLHRVLLF